MKKTTKKLKFAPETIRNLTPTELEGVAGGNAGAAGPVTTAIMCTQPKPTTAPACTINHTI